MFEFSVTHFSLDSHKLTPCWRDKLLAFIVGRVLAPVCRLSYIYIE